MWSEYQRAHQEGIDETDRAATESWDASWALLLLLMSGFRRRVGARAAEVEPEDRPAVSRFLAAALADVDDLDTATMRALVGRTKPAAALDRGTMGRGFTRALSAAEAANRAAGAVIDRDLAAFTRTLGAAGDAASRSGAGAPSSAGASPAAAPSSPVTPPQGMSDPRMPLPPAADATGAIDPSALEEVRRAVEDMEREMERSRSHSDRRMREDMGELGGLGGKWVAVDLAKEIEALKGSIMANSSPLSRRGSLRGVIALLNGPGADRRKSLHPDGGWQFHAGHTKLAVVLPIRGIYRRRIFREALAAGITRFRMDLPADRMASLSPTSEAGAHAYRIRTWEEWLDIAERVNASKRGRTATFDTVGIGFGDVLYPVPVPDVYAVAAHREADRKRAAWLERMAKRDARRRNRRAA